METVKMTGKDSKQVICGEALMHPLAGEHALELGRGIETSKARLACL